MDWSSAATYRAAPFVDAATAGVALAAALAEQFALPHNPLDATLAAGDKAAQREQFEEAGVPQPSFRFLSVSEDPAELGASLGWPCVVKQ